MEACPLLHFRSEKNAHQREGSLQTNLQKKEKKMKEDGEDTPVLDKRVPVFCKLNARQMVACRNAHVLLHRDTKYYLVERMTFRLSDGSPIEIPAGFLFRGPPAAVSEEVLNDEPRGWILMEFTACRFAAGEKSKLSRLAPRERGEVLSSWLEGVQACFPDTWESVCIFSDDLYVEEPLVYVLPSVVYDYTKGAIVYSLFNQ